LSADTREAPSPSSTVNDIKPRIVLFSTLYPSGVRPGHGIFVQTRLRKLIDSGAVEARVVAPVPWFPSTDSKHGDHALMALTPDRETLHGIDVQHPRYPLPPKVGMNIAPFVLAAGAARSLRRLRAEGYDFDLIDAHYFYPDGVAAALLARWFRRPLAITARGSDINLISQYAWPRALMRWAARRADASIAVSAALAERMAAIGMPGERLQVLRNGVDLERFAPLARDEARRALGWPDQPTLLVVGRLLESKGQHLAIEALNALPEFCLCIVGEGPRHAALQALARQHGVAERVRFCGQVEHTALARYYSAADLLVLPSEREGMPNVVLEAMACGTDLVATAVGGIPEIVDGSTVGGLMRERSAAGLAHAVRAQWQRTPQRAVIRDQALRFDWSATTRAQAQLFARLARQRRGAALAAGAEAPPPRARGAP
jgi:teichuronic acid biosynthesis glycosyltransferase TuaC